jgi:TPR repeat protein
MMRLLIWEGIFLAPKYDERNPWDMWIPMELLRGISSAFDNNVKRIASGRILQAVNQSHGYGREWEMLRDRINRRMSKISHISDFRESALLGRVREHMGAMFPLVRLQWECLKRVRTGIPRHGGECYVDPRIVPEGEWRRLCVRRGSLLCLKGFWEFNDSIRAISVSPAEGEMEVRFEVRPESLCRVVYEGVRGFAAHGADGFVRPFAPMRVCSLRREAKRVTVRLIDEGWCGETPRGIPVAWPGASRSQSTREAETLYRKAALAIDQVEMTRCLDGAAELGHVGAMFQRGMLGRSGTRGSVDIKQALRWLSEAGKRGHSGAMCVLCGIFLEGEAVPKDQRAAISWFRKAAELGSVTAMLGLIVAYTIGDGAPADPHLVAAWCQKAADLGQPDAMDRLGDIYWHGSGLPANAKAAFDWRLKAAEVGFAPAMRKVALQLGTGGGVPMDQAAAFDWCRKAAERGDGDAMFCLGTIHAGGRIGVRQDFRLATAWWAKAAGQGHEGARLALAGGRWGS